VRVRVRPTPLSPPGGLPPAPPGPPQRPASLLGKAPFEFRDQILLFLAAVGLGLVAGALVNDAAVTSLSEAITRAYYIAAAWLADRTLTAVVVAAALGFWVSHYRYPLLRLGAKFFDAFVGEGGKSAWALQAAVAVFLVFAILLALRPELLDYVESFKAGEVEVKFSAVSTTTRQTLKFGLTNFIQETDLIDWKDFDEQYTNPEVAREQATNAFDRFPISLIQRRGIRNILLGYYVQPIALILPCLDRMGRLPDAREKLRPLANSSRKWVLSVAEFKSIQASKLEQMLSDAQIAGRQLYKLTDSEWEEACFQADKGQRALPRDERTYYT
jgi:hypothetical protein